MRKPTIPRVCTSPDCHSVDWFVTYTYDQDARRIIDATLYCNKCERDHGSVSVEVSRA